MNVMIKEAPPLKDILNWDISNMTETLTFWDHRLSFIQGQLNCLELGSDDGGISLWLATKGHKVICSSEQAETQRVRDMHAKYGVSHLITYRVIDPVEIPYDNELDLIIFKNILGKKGIQNGQAKQQMIIAEIYKALKPGGLFLFAEHLKATRLHNYLRTKFNSLGEAWRYINRKEMEDFLSDFRDLEMHSNGFLGTLGRNENQRSILGNFDRVVFDRIVPADWKYILYGYAIK